MRKLLLTLCAAVSAVAVLAADAPAAATAAASVDQPSSALAEARGKIGEAIESRELMGELMGGLSAAEQKQFLADVNKAIAAMPASTEEKTAKFLNANHAALKAAKKENLLTLIAEVFATVPPESLTVLNERFATDLLNRDSNPEVKYTDAQYTKVALDIMKVVNARTDETDNGSTRSVFAILMLIRASNGTPTDLPDRLIGTLKNEQAREMAKNEWIPAALGTDGNDKGYEPLLASADAGRRPDIDFVLVIAGPQYVDSILGDCFGKNVDEKSFSRTSTPILDAVTNPLQFRAPVLGGDIPGAAGAAGDGHGAATEGDTRILPPGAEKKQTPEPEPEPEPEPRPYVGTRTF